MKTPRRFYLENEKWIIPLSFIMLVLLILSYNFTDRISEPWALVIYITRFCLNVFFFFILFDIWLIQREKKKKQTKEARNDNPV